MVTSQIDLKQLHQIKGDDPVAELGEPIEGYYWARVVDLDEEGASVVGYRLAPKQVELSATEKVRQFHNQHGDHVIVEGMVIYENGARRENAALGLMMPPPKDPWERARIVRLFWKKRLEFAATDFRTYKQRLVNQKFLAAHEVETLRQLQEQVFACREQLEDAEEQVKDNHPHAHALTPLPPSEQDLARQRDVASIEI